MGKVFQGIVMVLVLAAAGLAWRLIVLYYGTAYLQHTTQTAMDQVVVQSKRNAYVSQQQYQGRAPAAVGRQLAANERCVGGSIVRFDQINGVPTYTQESDGSHPLACPQAN